MWAIIEPCLFILIALFIISQWILPPFIGKPFFWIFKHSTNRIDNEYDKIQDIKDEIEIQRIRDERQKLTRKMVD